MTAAHGVLVDRTVHEVLNVDDDDVARYAKSRVLRHAGYSVVEAATGGDALRLVRERRPSLVLLDVQLPDLSGIEVCRRIKSDPVLSETLVLQTSATYTSTADRVRGLVGGADGYLPQPAEPEELLANLQALLRLRDAESKLRESERALAASERRYRTLVEGSSAMTWRCGPGGGAPEPEPGWMIYTGQSPGELAGNGWLDAVHPDDRARVAAAWAAAVARSEPLELEYRLRRRDGSWRCNRSRAVPVRDDDGRLVEWAGMNWDVTEQRALEAELQDHETRLRLALEAASMGTWQADVPAGRFDASPDAGRLHGLGPSGATSLQAAGALIHPDDRDRVRALLEEAARGGGGYVVEYRAVRPDGAIRWVVSAARGVRDADGRPTGRVIGTVRDVTAEKAVEGTLRAFYVASPLLMGTVELGDDGDLLHLYDNPAAERFFGVPPGQTAQRRARELGVAEPVVRLWRERYLQTAAARAPVSFEYRHGDGASARVLAVTVARLDEVGPGGRPAFCYVAQDVTDARRTYEEHERSRALLDAVLSALPAGAIIADATGRLVRWNRANEELWGLHGRDPRAFDGVESYEAWRGWWYPGGERLRPGDWGMARALRDREVVAGELVEIERFDGGGRRVILNMGAPVLSPAGELLGAVVVQTDMTAQVAAQAALRDSEQRLRQADRRKDEFLATLSHELRNPLAPIRTAARLLGDPMLGAAETAWVQGVIQRQVTHMALLLDDLLDVARITQGKLELRRARVDLAGVIDAAVESARPLIDARRHALAVTMPEGDVSLDADPVRLAQVVANLLTNAAKYTDPGGRIELRVDCDDAATRIAVRDSGIGLDAAALPELFVMFSQVRGTERRSEGGLGIGLALVKGIVELHGGSVSAHSAGPGHGSEFVVSLPRASDDAAAAASVGDGATAGTATRRVLVADDNVDAAESLAMLLRLAGHELRVAHDGRAAVAVARDFRPEVALLDIGMPVMDGYDTARALRAEPWARRLLLVAITGWGQDEDRRRALEAGFDRHLTKPVDPAEVEALLGESGDRPRGGATGG